MRKTTVILHFLLFAWFASAQITVNDHDINADPNIHYIEVHTFVTAWYIAWGPKLKLKEATSQVIKGADGERYIYESDIALFNFLHLNGWVYIEKLGDTQLGAIYLFKKIH